MPANTKYIVIAGSIMSGLGKGIVAASIAKLLQARGYNVIPVKFDGYLNVDCGTMNPFRHGEVFVLDDGTEVDMDFGTYERFLGISLDQNSSITGGKLFKTIIEKERKGEYLGRDVQFIPHLTDEIKKRLRELGKNSRADIVLIEVGGTVGDLENGYFLEAIRQLQFEDDNMMLIQLSYVPSLSEGEQKTKPTQQATRLLQSIGLYPKMILCREQEKLSREVKRKIGTFCNVHEDAVIDDPLVNTVYELPLVLEKQGVYPQIAKTLGLEERTPKLDKWRKLTKKIIEPGEKKVSVAIVGKYTAVKDAYVSVHESLVHAAAANNCSVDISWVESTDIEKEEDAAGLLCGYDGIIVPGGYGTRGVEGKIKAIQYARENKVPYLGLCLGMQLMVIEFARNVCGMDGASSTEFDKKTKYPVVALLKDQEKIENLGGTNRLGSYECRLKKGTKAHDAYGTDVIHERHRHRYEVNPELRSQLEECGLVISGEHPSGIAEIAEWPDGFGVGTQPHIELKSRLESPAPLFVSFVKAMKGIL
jgi:CTP synthase